MKKSSIISKDSIKTLAYFVGRLLGLFGVLFVLYKLSQEYTVDSFVDRFVELISITPYLLVINILSMMLGIFVWHMMLLHYSNIKFSYKISYYFFAKTEIAKYLPGNIFHFLGRQLLANKLELSQSQMVKVSSIFTLLLVVGTILSATLFFVSSSGIDTYTKILLLILALLSIGVTLYLFPSFDRVKKLQMDTILTISIGMQGIMMGIIIFSQIDSSQVGLFFQVVGIYIFSWLVGFVTPGASGGIGVREGAFIAMAEFWHLSISSEIILFSILFIRLINIVADLVAYLSTLFIKDEIF
jgi:hypothetical protein